jgi:peptidoglycan/LPS O-acetylase OafA/YrhL
MAGQITRLDLIARPRAAFRRDIEGLRTVAVLAVVGFHYGISGIKGGFVGVDIFFVVSGYLITGLLIDELFQTGRIDLPRFYGRRARRLLPAALLVSLTTLICSTFVFSPPEQQALAKAAAASSLYVSNLWFAQQSVGYFSAQSAFNPFLHTWSLSVEEQFYVLWPTFLLLVGRAPNGIRMLAKAMIAVVLVSFVSCLWLTSVRQPWAFYSLPTRAWEFGLGGLGCLVPVRWLRTSLSAAVIGWVGMLFLIFSCIAFYDISRFPGPDALLAAAATVCVLISGASADERGPAHLLNTKPFQWFGARSYSIYLWHWPILVFATASEPLLSAAGRFACFILTLCCAAMSYKLLEQPIRASQWLGSRPLRSVGLGAILTLAGAFLAIGSAVLAKRFASTPFQKMIGDVTKQAPRASGVGRGCLLDLTDSKPVACVFGAPMSARTVVLFGDSHADQWSTPIISLAEQQGWRVVTYLKASCSVADVPVYDSRLHRFSPECSQWRAQVLAEVAHLHPTGIVVAEFSSGYIRGPITGMSENAVDLPTWSDGLRRSLRALHGAGVPVIVLRDNPSPGKNIRDCLARAEWHGLPTSICETSRLVALDASVTKTERDAAASVPGVHFIDLSSMFCDSTACPPMREGIVVYRDAHHLTTRYAAHLLEPMKSALLPIIRDPDRASEVSMSKVSEPGPQPSNLAR